MIGDKRLEIPETVGECLKIHRDLGLQCDCAGSAAEYLFDNAKRIVELNNEVYEKINKLIEWLEREWLNDW